MIVILFKRAIGCIALAESIILWMNPGRMILCATTIFFPDMTLSTSGIIIPMETPLNAEEAIMQRPADTSTHIWGTAKPTKRL
jgi:uncharacterized membrane protein